AAGLAARDVVRGLGSVRDLLDRSKGRSQPGRPSLGRRTRPGTRGDILPPEAPLGAGTGRGTWLTRLERHGAVVGVAQRSLASGRKHDPPANHVERVAGPR